MKCAEAFAKCSSAERLKVGSVIVKNNRIISCGYNALPSHIDGSCEVESEEGLVTRPEVRHSEINALYGLLKSTESSEGSVLFCTHQCCKFCAIDIVDAGIVSVYYRNTYGSDEGLDYLTSNGVKSYKLDY